MALKRSSEIITISGLYNNNTNGFTVDPVDLQLNPLDQEVFVVLAVQADFLGNIPVGSSAAAQVQRFDEPVAFTTTRPTAQVALSNSTCFAYASRQVFQQNTVDPAGDPGIITLTYHERTPSDTPDTNLDYIAIIATSDFFVSGTDATGKLAGEALTVAYKIYGYRAKADSATYAALVQSEVLSS